MLTYFHEIYTKVTEYLTTTGQFDTQVVQVNPKGDQTKAFDYKTEAMILEYFDRQLPFAVNVLTEERGELTLGSGSPEYTIIIDPVDGSDNFTRGLGMTGFSVAAIPAGEALTVENVKYGFVGHLFLKKIFTFEKGKGAFCNQTRLSASKEGCVQNALISAYIVGQKAEHLTRAYPLLQHITKMRCFGSAAYEVCQVAAGGLDAYIDIRNLCTPENFMAAAPMVLEVGGMVTDEHGEALAPIEKLDYGYNVVMSGNRALHEAILQYFA
ncbi:MAG: inositol monophosphatase family protein [Candidatus Vecturithrix sp.]|jgi:myo-inositol-1(or 4)-monophosphatase|nr:inositol monophosphatase family protein [Candidatus Vecturithrix sp.]